MSQLKVNQITTKTLDGTLLIMPPTNISSTTASSSTGTGALTISGGLGVAGNAFIGANVSASGLVISGHAIMNTVGMNRLNINSTGTGIYLAPYGDAQQIEFAGGGSPTLPNSRRGSEALPYSIYREGGSWNDPSGSDPTYPDLVISYHTGIKLIAHKAYGGTRFYFDYLANKQTDANILLSVGNGDDHVRVGSPQNTTTNLLVYGSIQGNMWSNGQVTPASYIQTNVPGSASGFPVGTVWYIV